MSSPCLKMDVEFFNFEPSFATMPFAMKVVKMPSNVPCFVSYSKFVKYCETTPNYRTTCENFCKHVFSILESFLIAVGVFYPRDNVKPVLFNLEKHVGFNHGVSETLKSLIHAVELGLQPELVIPDFNPMTLNTIARLVALKSKKVHDLIVKYLLMFPNINDRPLHTYSVLIPAFSHSISNKDLSLKLMIDLFIKGGLDIKKYYLEALFQYVTCYSKTMTIQDYTNLINIGFEYEMDCDYSEFRKFGKVQRVIFRDPIKKEKCPLIPIMINRGLAAIKENEGNASEFEYSKILLRGTLLQTLEQVYKIRNPVMRNFDTIFKDYKNDNISELELHRRISREVIPLLTSVSRLEVAEHDYSESDNVFDELLSTISFTIPLNSKYRQLFVHSRDEQVSNYDEWTTFLSKLPKQHRTKSSIDYGDILD